MAQSPWQKVAAKWSERHNYQQRLFSAEHITDKSDWERAASVCVCVGARLGHCAPRMEWDAAKGPPPHRVCNISINTLSARAIKPPHSASQPSILVRRWLGGGWVGWMGGCRPSVSPVWMCCALIIATLNATVSVETANGKKSLRLAVRPRVFQSGKSKSCMYHSTSFWVWKGLFGRLRRPFSRKSSWQLLVKMIYEDDSGLSGQ